MTDNRTIMAALVLTYFIFAMLLNSVGIVILQAINSFDVSKGAASVLEGFKDIPIAVVSFLVAVHLARLGYRRAMIIGLLLVAGACVLMPLAPGFMTAKLHFLLIGTSFALVKVSVYTTVGLLSTDRQSHAARMTTLEGGFMVGVLCGYWLFGLYVNPNEPQSQYWLNVYYWLAGASIFAAALWSRLQYDESGAQGDDETQTVSYLQMLGMIKLPLIYVFICAVFLYVLIEQGIGTWLPTFNNEILGLPTDISIQITSIFAGCLAIGRLGAGYLLKFLNWHTLLNLCLVCMMALILLTLPMTSQVDYHTSQGWSGLPLAAWILPCVGLFMAPIYPIINSVLLSALPQYQHAATTGLIVVFSALGGTTGSLITGNVFAAFGGQNAFYLTLLPIALIILAMIKFKGLVNQAPNAAQSVAGEHPQPRH